MFFFLCCHILCSILIIFGIGEIRLYCHLELPFLVSQKGHILVFKSPKILKLSSNRLKFCNMVNSEQILVILVSSDNFVLYKTFSWDYSNFEYTPQKKLILQSCIHVLRNHKRPNIFK